MTTACTFCGSRAVEESALHEGERHWHHACGACRRLLLAPCRRRSVRGLGGRLLAWWLGRSQQR